MPLLHSAAGAVRRGGRRGENGFALLVVLWVLTLLCVIAAVVSFETRSGTRVARNMVEKAAARAAADAGIQRVILDLVDVSDTNASQIRPDGKEYTWRFANSTVHLSFQDQGGKLDLNQASEDILVPLFASVGVAPDKAQALAAAVADFRDPDDFPRLNGAEDAEYHAAGLAWGSKNAPFQTLDELQQVLGMTPEIYRRVAPYVTTYSMGGAINPALAGELLTGILRDAGFKYFGPQAIRVFSIRAEARGSGGASFIREAVVQLSATHRNPVIMSWQQGVPRI